MLQPRSLGWAVAGALFAAAGVASASETIAYAYDAKGRLKSVSTTGGPANATSTGYQFDAADNRVNVTTTGATKRVAVVPSGGGFQVVVVN